MRIWRGGELLGGTHAVANQTCTLHVLALQRPKALTNVEGDWKRELRFLRDAAKILASFRPNGNTRSGVAKVEVAESAVETWDSLLSSGDCADLTLVREAKLVKIA
eukprot:5904419-Amphidinium_carterae.1